VSYEMPVSTLADQGRMLYLRGAEEGENSTAAFGGSKAIGGQPGIKNRVP